MAGGEEAATERAGSCGCQINGGLRRGSDMSRGKGECVDD